MHGFIGSVNYMHMISKVLLHHGQGARQLSTSTRFRRVTRRKSKSLCISRKQKKTNDHSIFQREPTKSGSPSTRRTLNQVISFQFVSPCHRLLFRLILAQTSIRQIYKRSAYLDYSNVLHLSQFTLIF
jgi:hypothetical protein